MKGKLLLSRDLVSLPWLLVSASLLAGPGTLLRADIVAEPMAVDFGDLALVHLGAGAPGDLRYFVEAPVAVRNMGTAPVDIVSISVPAGSPFVLRENKCAVLDAGSACTISIRYEPRAPGGHSAALEVRASDGEELLVPLWGDAVKVSLDGSDCDAPAVDFGSAPDGEERPRILGFVNETGGEVLAGAEVSGAEDFVSTVSPPRLVAGNGEEFSVLVTCKFTGSAGLRQGLCTWNVPTPMLPVVRAVKMPLLAKVNGCFDGLGSYPLPAGFALDRKKKSSFLAVSRPRKSEAGISRRLIAAGRVAGRPAIASSRVEYLLKDGDPVLEAWKPLDLGAIDPVLGVLPLLSARPKKIAEPADVTLAMRLKSRVLAVSSRKARLVNLQARRKIAEARIKGPVAARYDGLLAASALRQTRAYAVRRRETGPCLATVRVKRREAARVLDVPELGVECAAMPPVAGLRAARVKALAAVPVRAQGGAWQEKLVVAARYRARGGVDPDPETRLLLLGKRGREVEAHASIPPRYGEITSISARRKKGPIACLDPRQGPAGLYAAVGTRAGRILGYRAKRDPGTEQWSWALERRSKLPHRVRDLIWKGEDVYSCGELTQDLVAVGRREITLLETSTHCLRRVARARRRAGSEVWGVSYPSHALRGDSRPLYVLEKRKDGGSRVLALRGCRTVGSDPLTRALEQPVLATGDCIFFACKKKEAEGAWVELEAHAFDRISTVALHYSWTAPGVELDDPTSPTPRGFFPAGETMVYVVVRDGPADDPETRESAPRVVRVVVSDGGSCAPCSLDSFDTNGDAQVDISDAIRILSWLFTGGPAPSPMTAADMNADGKVDISDPVYLLTFLFLGGPGPVCPAAGN